ncbi:MAG: GNAT family N-acetyltransferase [Verrucomicrobiota bacterium]|nr:GNAT family N-acetyltransferase [Verrucomicrobiota bacterium]
MPHSPDALSIRAATDADRDAIWEIFHATVAPGDAFVYNPNTPRGEAEAYWFAKGTRSYVAQQDGKVVGSYILRANRPGLGDHVANAGFMVAPEGRGLGVGRAMGEHALAEARRLGYRAMQFNFVISTNESAVHLWKQLGFEIVGTLPGAFRHARKGFVDAYVMFRSLDVT